MTRVRSVLCMSLVVAGVAASCWYEVRMPLGPVACGVDADCGTGFVCRAGRCGCVDAARGGFDCALECPPGRSGIDCNDCRDARFGGEYCDECLLPHFQADCATCEDGYRLEAGSCVDIDECAAANGGCLHGATCVNTPGGRTCGCVDDWSGPVCGCSGGMAGYAGGTFNRGEGGSQQRVLVAPFCLDVTEVRSSAFLGSGTDDHPATGMNWEAARAFCARSGKRLPTEAEWEFAARGVAGRTFPWGEDDPDCRRAAFGACALVAPASVGTHAEGATPEGVEDLAGNAWEWIEDCFVPYGADGESGPVGAAPDCTERVVRGGGFSSPAAQLRGAGRAKLASSNGRDDLGFRCAADVAR